MPSVESVLPCLCPPVELTLRNGGGKDVPPGPESDGAGSEIPEPPKAGSEIPEPGWSLQPQAAVTQSRDLSHGEHLRSYQKWPHASDSDVIDPGAASSQASGLSEAPR